MYSIGFHEAVDIVAIAIVFAAFFTAFVYPSLAMGKAMRQSCVALARAVEAREPYLLNHSELTAALAVSMARESLRFWPWEVRNLELSALLHLIGKVSVPHAILNSEFGLTAQEQSALREYVRIGAQIVDTIPSLKGASKAIMYHREYADGSGYPAGRLGASIPLDAQILCVATEFVSMTRPRIYRGNNKECTCDQALDYFEENAGIKYDRLAVDLLKSAVYPAHTGIRRLIKLPARKIATATD